MVFTLYLKVAQDDQFKEEEKCDTCSTCIGNDNRIKILYRKCEWKKLKDLRVDGWITLKRILGTQDVKV